MLGPQYDGVPQRWEWIVEQFDELAAADARFKPISDVASWLASSPYRAAGLCGVKSMHSLLVAPSGDVFANPRLVIGFVSGQTALRLRHEDGSLKPWSRDATPGEIREVLEHFFIQRAGWYRSREGRPTPGMSSGGPP